MKKGTGLKSVKGGVILVLTALVTITGSKLLSELYLTEKTETEHFIFSWAKDEAQFFNCLPAAVEENYQRISKDLNSTASEKITIKLYDNSWIYNLSIGNPLIRGGWHEGIAEYEHLMPLKAGEYHGKSSFFSHHMGYVESNTSGMKAIQARQPRRLKELVEFVRTHSDFYADKYSHVPDRIHDVRQLPPVMKPELLSQTQTASPQFDTHHLDWL